MKLLRWLDNNLEITLSVALVSAMTVILAIQVFMRYVIGASLYWSEEVARYMFIWLIYLSISHGAHRMRHIKLDAALSLFPVPLRKYVVIIGDILFLVFALYVIWTSRQVVLRQLMLGQTSPAMALPMWAVYSAPMVGFALTALRQTQVIWYRVTTLNKSTEEEVEV
ncbi:TRAP transporter small permease [Breoghania sp.]|uniref:TRAP transporter small permease n=1 Tax=Breoghania sp. TaxID=2065378 RepID=UPI002AAB89D2|nr:TRAP transporter small permease [Breoghania sp.]